MVVCYISVVSVLMVNNVSYESGYDLIGDSIRFMFAINRIEL